MLVTVVRAEMMVLAESSFLKVVVSVAAITCYNVAGIRGSNVFGVGD